MTEWALNELMSILLSRELRDGEVCFVGVGSSGRAHELVTRIPISAIRLAQCRGLDVELQIGPPIGPDLDALPASWSDNDVYSWHGSLLIPSEMSMDALVRGAVSVGFMSAAQIDRHGNVNVSRIRSGDSWTRLGGALAVPELCAFAGRSVVLCDVSPRVFVEDVDYVSGFGHERDGVTRADLGLPGGGPTLVVTDLALFDFEGHELRLTALYPGVSPKHVADRMGFAPLRKRPLEEVDPPTPLELRRLREFELPEPESH